MNADIKTLIGEATAYDKKQQLEVKRPKSWLKSVSAFANGEGGTLVFGISDDDHVVGLADAEGDAERISEEIKTKLDPIPAVNLEFKEVGSPDISRGKLFDSIENLYLCAMNNQGLLALAQLILPSEILTNFEVVRVEEEASLIRIYLDESVKVEYKENPEIESKGFCEAVTIRDFPIRDKGVDLIVRRRKWYDKQNNRYFSDSYELKAEGTRYSKEFAAFLKGVYGDDSYDLPFA